jgi:hypothetical protein
VFRLLGQSGRIPGLTTAIDPKGAVGSPRRLLPILTPGAGPAGPSRREPAPGAAERERLVTVPDQRGAGDDRHVAPRQGWANNERSGPEAWACDRYRCVACRLRYIVESGHGLPPSLRYPGTASLSEQRENEPQRGYGLWRKAYVSHVHIKAVVAELVTALHRRFTWRGIPRGNCRRRRPSGRPRRRTWSDRPAWRQRQARPCAPGQRRRLL